MTQSLQPLARPGYPNLGAPVTGMSPCTIPTNSYQSFQGSDGNFYNPSSSMPMAPISRHAIYNSPIFHTIAGFASVFVLKLKINDPDHPFRWRRRRSTRERDMEEEEKHDELDPNQKSKRAKEDQGLTMAEESMSVEWIFEAQEVPSWQKHLTARAFVVSFGLSVLFTYIVVKLNLTTGITPSLTMSPPIFSTWTRLLEKSGLPKQPFTRQENTVIQTCVAASSGVAFS
ncbi:putative metal-nicotianamine transporter YSL5, partial [Cucurbita argyrosperma subsp. argyrosperma]